MALPLPKVVSDVGPGGGLVSAMGGMNALKQAMLESKMQEIKNQYEPQTLQANAASKLAYAQLLGPQFVAKLLGNEGAVANLGSDRAKQALNAVSNAGMGVTNGNAINQGPTYNGVGQPSTNAHSGWLMNHLKNFFGQKPPQQGQGNPLNNPIPQEKVMPNREATAPREEGDDINHELDEAMDEWSRSPEGQREFSKGSRAKIPSEYDVIQWYRDQKRKNPPLKIDMRGGQHEPTYAENTGAYKGTLEQGKEAGKYRAAAQKDIGNSQLALSNSGESLHRMAGLIKNPVFQDMRAKIPFFQDKQLGWLEKTGTPEQKKLIGDFITTGEQIIASGVQAFGGKPLVREFDLLQRQKINRNDPVHVAEGKLRASIALHDIAEQKNEIIDRLLDQGISEAKAVKQANKMIDVSAIEKQTEDMLRDKPTDADIEYMAKKRGISVDEVKKQLKARGLM